ncbi:hypothetical protein GCM10007079_07370 [Nocardiopsis terrae]|nr:hypothetical protein GCM10007079_07370 [Nocardiopsis terrae]
MPAVASAVFTAGPGVPVVLPASVVLPVFGVFGAAPSCTHLIPSLSENTSEGYLSRGRPPGPRALVTDIPPMGISGKAREPTVPDTEGPGHTGTPAGRRRAFLCVFPAGS